MRPYLYSMHLPSPLPPRLDLYKASAGSGKTFLLTKQYLKLMLQGETGYREILAVTFTNRATAEMRHRILSELKNLATGVPTKYGKVLLQEVEGLTEGDLQQHAATVYSNILHDYSRFNVTTIDSFVQKIIRSFAYEIGLDDGFRLQMNENVVKEDLAERLYNLLDTNKALRQWVTDMAVDRLSDGKNWDFKADMLELAAELFKERFNSFDEAMKPMTEEDKAKAFTRLRSQVFITINSFRKQQETWAKEALELLHINGLNPADFSYGNSGFINHFYKASRKEFCAPGNRVLTIIDDPAKMAGAKVHPLKKQTIHSICDKLHQLLKALVDHYGDNIEKYITAKAISANLYSLQLMQVFTNELANYRSENNMLLISDANLLLRKIAAENDASFIFEKTGARFRHFLIDEFQDTSVFQWDNFRPLVENAMGEGKYNLVVGDVKQAIYRWRSGDWRLLHTGLKKQLGHQPVQTGTLQDNYRSARPVIECNNYLFNVLPRRLQQHFNSQMQGAPDDIQLQLQAQNYFNVIEAAYADSYQHIPKNANGQGVVHLEFIKEQEDEDGNWRSFEEEVLYRLPRQVERMIGEFNYGPKDITILTRNNQEARLAIQSLIEYQQLTGTIQFDVLSADALYLDSNESVQMLIAALRWLSNPADTISKAFIIQTLAKNLGESVSSHRLYECNAKNEELLPAAFIHDRNILQNLPILELINRLIDLLNLHRIPSGYAYLLAFQDVVLDWVRYGRDGLQAFLNYWDEEGHLKALPASGGNAVEVMTIHKAKGLDFGVVLLPFCNWCLEPDAKKNNWLWVKTAGTSFDDIPMVPVKYKKDVSHSSFAFEYFEEQLLTQMDALNLLYVALTRAKQQIIAYAPLPKPAAIKNKTIGTIGDLLYDVLSNQQAANDSRIPAVQDAFSEGILYYGHPPEEMANADDPAPGLALTNMVYGHWQQQLRIRPAALRPEEETVLLPRDRSTLLLAALAKLQTPPELPSVLLQMERQGLLSPQMKKEIQQILEKAMQHALFQPWVQGGMRRLGAQNMLTHNQQIKRPSLVLINDTETRIIEFKFTNGKEDGLMAAQVNSMVRLFEQMQFANVSGYVFDGLKNEVV